MICRHSANDPSCSSHRDYVAPYSPPEPIYKDYRSKVVTPDSEKFKVLDAKEIDGHLLLKVLYPNCASCAFEGTKVLLFFNMKAIDALRWRKIDPHFTNQKRLSDEAPSPNARFPASKEGWEQAIAFAHLMKR